MSKGLRKIILWSVVILLGSALLFWWAKNFQEKLRSFRGEEFIEGLEMPEIKMPNIEVPKEELKEKVRELEEIIQEAEEYDQQIPKEE